MKVLVIAESTPDCYPSLQLNIIKNKESFDNFMGREAIIESGESFSWDNLVQEDAYAIQGILNSFEESEYCLELIDE